jgi:sigma-B regulation protein RsbU (phosphoserine phosphatase)
MAPAHRFAEFLSDLQQLERATAASQGPMILDAFTRHTQFSSGAVYLRDARDTSLRLAAKTQQCVAPEILELNGGSSVNPVPQLIVPIRSLREEIGMLLLSHEESPANDDELAFAHAAATFLGTVMTNSRLLQETREGDFQLKYRLWELESLYDIGLSIAGTLNIEELADEILFRMISLTNARRAALFLRQGERFSLYRSFGDVRSEFLEEDITQQILREGAPLSFNEGIDCIFPECSALVAVPIRGNNAVIGVLAAGDRETREGGIGQFEANDLRLLGLFANQVAIALENSRLHREALEKQVMQRELELAATIQRDILPKRIPEVAGMEIAAWSQPARQVGGDYHAFFEQDGVVTVLVADVAGKSMPAALLVSALHAALQLLFEEGRELGDIATELNKHIHRWSSENKFITFIVVSIDRETDVIRYVNAGHNPAYVILDGRMETLKSHGLPIGILGQSRYSTQTMPFPKHSTIVLYSDGITEAENVAGDEFDNPRLEAVINENPTATAAELTSRIAKAVEEFVGEAPQKDDQTLLVVRRID